MGTLFIVSTPIGNLEDITIRAIKTLLSVDTVACEDTRRTGLLLKHLRSTYHTLAHDTQVNDSENKTPDLISYYEQNEFRRIPEIINALKNGLNVALVSDAGTPAISDPGFRLIRECVREGIRVESIPGPSSVISGLVSSGLPTDKFLFLGYPPHKPGHRKQLYQNLLKCIESFKNIQPTVVLFEAPHKLITTLQELQEVFGDMEITICRELTKMHEEVRRESINKSIQHFSKQTPKGEFVLLFHLSQKETPYKESP